MWKFIKYRFNKALEQNLFNLILFLLGISILGIFLFSTLGFILQKIGVLSEKNFFIATVWQGAQLFFDQNAVFDLDVEKNNFFDFFFKFNLTIFGIIIFSTLIGIITNYISSQIESLRTGKTKIEEENHIIFFNFSRRLIPLISELCTAYEKQKQSFVIVSNEEPLSVLEKINNITKIPKNITLVARKGYAWQKSLQEKINLQKAKQLIILKPDVGQNFITELECDVEVGKSIASLIGSDQWDKNPCSIIAEFHNEERGYLYLYSYCGDIIFKKMGKKDYSWQVPNLISSSSLKNDILSQCVNTPELSTIYDNIFGYEGSEIYFLNPTIPKFSEILRKQEGKTIKDLNYLCDNVIVIGFYLHDPRHKRTYTKIFLNPPIDFPYTEKFGMICVAKNEGQIINEFNNIIQNPTKNNELKDLNATFNSDTRELKIALFDYSNEENNLYLINLINAIINNNYYNNLKGINVYKNKIDNSLKEKAFLNQLPNYHIKEFEENHPYLGIVIYHFNTEDKLKHNFQIYSINKNSILKNLLNSGDIILNVVLKSEVSKLNKSSELDLSFTYKIVYGSPEKKFKSHLIKLLDNKKDLCIIFKSQKTKQISFIDLKFDEIIKQKEILTNNFKEIEDARFAMINTIYQNINFIERDLNEITNNMKPTTVNEFKNDNCFIFFNETNQQIQKFRENPIEDHVMINNFVGFSNLRLDEDKNPTHSMITEINGFRTKKILENYKSKYFSPYLGNDIVEMNSIISKYIAASTFDIKHSDLINILFGRCHTIKAHTLMNKELRATFCELENYFHNLNETLIGIIDYEFDVKYKQKRRIKNILINPDQTKEIVLDKGDRMITIANFNDLEMVNQIKFLRLI